MDDIHVYGTTWCPDCTRAKRVLEKNGLSYAWTNIEQDDTAREYVQRINGGYKSVPTIVFPDGSVLVEPANGVLQEKIDSLAKGSVPGAE